MLLFLLVIFSFTAYGLATLVQLAALRKQSPYYPKGSFLISALAIVAHTVLLYHWIEPVEGGQNLTLINIITLLCWLAALITAFLSLLFPIGHLLLFVLPVAAFSLILAWLFPGYYVIPTGESYAHLSHIVLALFAAGILIIAAFQALLIRWQDGQLKRHNPSTFSMGLPSLEQMEKGLFSIIWIGFGLLSLLLVTSFFVFPDALVFPLAEKTFITSLTWLIFFILLIGRYVWGWRAKVVANWALIGVGLLLLIYPLGRWIFSHH